MQECCRVIKASLNARVDFNFAAAQYQLPVGVILGVLEAPAAKPTVDLYHDHGPPGAISFAEIVLQHSLLGHAPPVVA